MYDTISPEKCVTFYLGMAIPIINFVKEFRVNRVVSAEHTLTVGFLHIPKLCE